MGCPFKVGLGDINARWQSRVSVLQLSLFSSVEQARVEPGYVYQAVSTLVAFLTCSRESALAHKTTENDTISDMGIIVLVHANDN